MVTKAVGGISRPHPSGCLDCASVALTDLVTAWQAEQAMTDTEALSCLDLQFARVLERLLRDERNRHVALRSPRSRRGDCGGPK